MSEYNYGLVVQFENGWGKQDYSIWNDFSKDRLVPYLNENYPGWVSARHTIFRYNSSGLCTGHQYVDVRKNNMAKTIRHD